MMNSPANPPLNLLGLDQIGLAAFFAALGEKPFRAAQVLQWIHQRGVIDFAAMTNLSKSLRQQLQDNAAVSIPPVIAEQTAADGTRKWLFQLDRDNAVETVFIPEDDRNTLCISSQVGCPLKCRFCATGQQGFSRHLTAAEIIAQLWYVEHQLRAERRDKRVITNVVFMGMGEPLLNYEQVLTALRILLDDFAYGLSRRRVTLSTAGIIPAIERLKIDCPVSLAISLHATDDALREQLLPINKKYPLAELLATCRHYAESENRRRITFEYLLLKDINDTPRHAHALVKLLRGIPAKINLIPFNAFHGTPYACSSETAREQFREILLRAGLMTITRKSRGGDIAAACGQLAGKVLNCRQKHLETAELSI